MKQIYGDLLSHKKSIVIVGLGYVGLPLACLLSKKFKVIGFDIDSKRISELKGGYDHTGEIETRDELLNDNISYTNSIECISQTNLIIVAVPTPIDSNNKPDLRNITSATEMLSKNIMPNTVIVYESTVYPGLTEDICRKIIESEGYRYKIEFFLGYSPERVNPGDKEHTIDKITKVISGCNEDVVDLLDSVYGAVIEAGTYRAPSIAVAEMSKVIENAQRDLNISFINEVAMICDRLKIDTSDVLKAAGTKWNFLPFEPGLVGGHCIGVDPYYLTHVAENLGMNPKVILAGRKTNDDMSKFVAKKAMSLVRKKRGTAPQQMKIAILGMSFKENISDFRNTKSVDIADHLAKYGVSVFCVDPVVDQNKFHEWSNYYIYDFEDIYDCDAIILAVDHDVFKKQITLKKIKSKLEKSGVLLDLKNMYFRNEAANLDINLWRM